MQNTNRFQVNSNDCENQTIQLPSNFQHHQPKDSISCLKWLPLPNTSVFVCTTWGGELIFYQVVAQNYSLLQQVAYFEYPHPLIAVCWKGDGSIVYFAAGDGSICAYQVQGGQVATIDQLQLPAVSIFWVEQYRGLLVVTIDGQIILYNTDNLTTQPLRWQVEQGVSCCDFSFPILVIGFIEMKYLVDNFEVMTKNGNQHKFDIRVSHMQLISPLCRMLLSGNQEQLLATSTLDGRCNVSKLMTKQSYNTPITYSLDSIITFRGHKEDRTIQDSYFKSTPTKVQDLYPINELSFNVQNPQFISTLGSDGRIIYWDLSNKNKIREFTFSSRPITSGSISYDGKYLAFGLGYDWNRGLQGMGIFPPSIHVIQINKQDLTYVKI